MRPLSLVWLTPLLLLAACTLPRDETMVRTFKLKQKSFEEVVTYFDDNTDVIGLLKTKQKLLRVFNQDDMWKDVEDARLEKLLGSTGVEKVWRSVRSDSDTPGGTFFRFDKTSGLSISYAIKGFAYLPVPPASDTLTNSLDNLPQHPRSMLYKPLGENWYLFIQHVD